MSKGKMGMGERGHGGSGATNKPMGDAGHAGKGGDSGFSFTFSEDNASVLTLSRSNATGTQTRALDTTDSTFVTTLGTNDLGNSAVVSVTETRTNDNAVMTRVYTDQDGDASYITSFGLQVSTVSDSHHPQHQFTFGADGSIATDTLVSLWGARSESIDSNEVYAQAALGEDSYVTKTTKTDQGYRFEVFRDDDADGNWTEVAHGQSTGVNIDTTTGNVSLTGIQSLLSAADALIG